MKRPASILVPALAAVAAGCSTDQLARAVYDSIRVGNPAVEQSLPGSAFRSAPVPYEQYERERRGDRSR